MNLAFVHRMEKPQSGDFHGDRFKLKNCVMDMVNPCGMPLAITFAVQA